MLRSAVLLLFSFASLNCAAQYHWELEKEKDGIQVFTSKVAHSEFKATKVLCTLEGDYQKLISVLSDVESMSDWVYKSSSCKLIERYSSDTLLYIVITDMPWPMSDRESIIHLKFNTDSLPHSLCITGSQHKATIAQTEGTERVTNYKAIWRVTMPEENKVCIEYILELDPGGGIPAWMANTMVEKGPYETFKGLSEKMKALD